MIDRTGTMILMMLAAAAFLGTAAAAARADEAPTLREGALVRVVLVRPEFGSLRDPKVVTGRLLACDDQELVLDVDHEPRAFPRGNIEALQLNLREGRHSRGAAIGFAVGAVGCGTAALIAAKSDDDSDHWQLISDEAAVGLVALTAGALGALVGALVAPGAAWQDVPLEGARLGAVRGPGGATVVGLQLRF